MILWPGGGWRKWVENSLRESTNLLHLQPFNECKNLSLITMSNNEFRFFLDSGAYSAWSRGVEIDIDEYCEFIRANIEVIDVYACLDCIPGTPGRPATEIEKENAAAKTWENYLYMKEQGLDPIPVYHYGENIGFLHRMLQYGCDYIGIGGLVGVPSKLRSYFLDRTFADLVDENGMPKVKTHGFGMTSLPLIFRYPWYSVDSTSWIKVTQNGGVYFPALSKDNEFLFDQIPNVVVVSSKNPRIKEDGKHVNSLGPYAKELLLKWLAECGVTLEEVSSNYYYRAVVNVSFFKKVSEAKLNKPFIPQSVSKQRLF